MEQSPDPKEKAERAQNISIPEVVTGKQPPDPHHQYGTVSPPPPSPDQYSPEPKVRLPYFLLFIFSFWIITTLFITISFLN